MKKLSAIGIVVLLLCSCMATKIPVGMYNDQKGVEVKFAKARQYYLFGAFPLGHAVPSTPKDGACMIVSKKSFIDIVIQGFTGGILQSVTMKVMVKDATITPKKK